MKTASAKEIKTELEQLDKKQLIDFTLRLTRFKKENKELLTYLLFDSSDEQGYVDGVRQMLHVMFTEVNVKNLYFTRKSVRKIVRTANRFIRYSDEPSTAIEVLSYVCSEIQNLNIDLKKSTALQNIYSSLLKKIKKLIGELHEDLQYDYNRSLADLEITF